MICGMTAMVSKSFVHPSPSGFLNTFRSPRLLSQPICRTLNFKFKQIDETPSASAVLICVDSSYRRISTSQNYEQFSRNDLVIKAHVLSRSKEARFDLPAGCKCIPVRSFASQSAVSDGIELAPFTKRKERTLKRSRNAAAAGSTDRSSRSSFSGDEEFSPLSVEQSRALSNFRNNESEAKSPGTKQSLISETFKSKSSAVVGEKDRSEQRTVFEKWAVHKLREDGLSSLAVIDDMRQTFAPDMPPLDPQLIFSDAELRELESRPIARRRFQPKTNRSYEKSSPASTNLVMPVDSTPSLKRSSEREMNVQQTEESINNVASSHPKPLLVKRKTILPENWNGLGGTVVLIDKPQGWSSFAVCGKLRHTLKIQKVGHAGTLDPMATGLLIVCLGKATKLADSYQAMTKVYSGTFRLGEDTPSLDADTEVSATRPWEHIRDEDIEREKEAFIGDIMQSPPMYSAIKVKGERLYAKARRGEEIEVPARSVTINKFEVNRSPDNRQEFHFRVTCSKGTYIRSLCSDLARALGSYAHLIALRREKIGSYSVSDAWRVEDLVETYNQQCRNFAFKVNA